jgi:membrane protein
MHLQVIRERIAYGSHCVGRFLRLVFRLYFSERGPRIAASLTYTTLLALVPLLAIGFAVFSRFPVFEELAQSAQTYFLEILTPAAGEGFRQHVVAFVAEARHLTQIGLLILFVSALLTLNTIDNALNDIWQVTRVRRVWTTMLAYITILFIGPLLLGLSISISTYITSLPPVSDTIEQTGAGPFLTLTPVLATLLAFTLLYKWVPNTPVRWVHAFVGGVVASLLFEVAKDGFALYLAWFPSYRIIYGALAALPLTLIWLFLAWTVVLLGAQTAYCLSVFHCRDASRVSSVDADERARIAWRVLAHFKEAGVEGLELTQLSVREAVLDDTILEKLVRELEATGLLLTIDSHHWRWNPDNDRLTIGQLVEKSGAGPTFWLPYSA